jgi:hypothetical protein
LEHSCSRRDVNSIRSGGMSRDSSHSKKLDVKTAERATATAGPTEIQEKVVI